MQCPKGEIPWDFLSFYRTDAIEELKNPPLPDYAPTTANERYASVNLGTWSSISDVDVFLSRFKHSNDYKDGDTELALGNYVTINDGTYNAVWEIAGFDIEYKQLAADDTTYNNGLGICMIPQTQVTRGQWNESNTFHGAYMSSYMHSTVLPNIVTKLQTILGSHIVERNVLLSSNIGGSSSNIYTWTTTYATLMSVGQMTGNFAANNTKYDDGEANYKLPIFNYKEYKTGYDFWTRGVWGFNDSDYRYYIWFVDGNGSINGRNVNYDNYVRPLIYLR